MNFFFFCSQRYSCCARCHSGVSIQHHHKRTPTIKRRISARSALSYQTLLNRRGCILFLWDFYSVILNLFLSFSCLKTKKNLPNGARVNGLIKRSYFANITRLKIPLYANSKQTSFRASTLAVLFCGVQSGFGAFFASSAAFFWFCLGSCVGMRLWYPLHTSPSLSPSVNSPKWKCFFTTR